MAGRTRRAGHRIGHALLAAALAIVVGIAFDSPSAADVVDEPPHLVEIGEDAAGQPIEVYSVSAVSPNGRYAIVNDLFTSYHVDLLSDVTTGLAISRAQPLDDGEFVIGSIYDPADGSYTPARERVGSMTPTSNPPARVVEIGLDPDLWRDATVRDSTPDGRYLLLAATTNDNFQTSWFVYDDETATLLTPLDGLPSLEGDRITAFVELDPERPAVTYFATCCAGATWSSYERLDYLTGELTSIARPADFAGFNWTLSPNEEWIIFYAAEAGIVDGLDDSPRLYRRDVSTGITRVVPMDPAVVGSLERFVIANDGTAVYLAEILDPDDDLDGTDQLFAWNGGPDATMTTRGVDGRPADRGIESPVFSSSSTVVVFASFSTNLVSGLPGPGDPGDFERRVYTFGEPDPEPDPDPEPEPDPEPDPDPSPERVTNAATVDTPAVRCAMDTDC